MNATQPSLWDAPAARRSDPHTSHAAADKVTRNGTRAAGVATVVRLVKQTPGLTSAELAKRHGADRYMVARRLPDAEKAGLVRKGDPRPCGTTGNAAVTWWPPHEPD